MDIELNHRLHDLLVLVGPSPDGRVGTLLCKTLEVQLDVDDRRLPRLLKLFCCRGSLMSLFLHKEEQLDGLLQLVSKEAERSNLYLYVNFKATHLIDRIVCYFQRKISRRVRQAIPSFSFGGLKVTEWPMLCPREAGVKRTPGSTGSAGYYSYNYIFTNETTKRRFWLALSCQNKAETEVIRGARFMLLIE